MVESVNSRQQSTAGAGLRILTQTVTSPTLTTQLQSVLAKFPAGKMASVGTGRPRDYRSASVDTIYHFDKADAIVSLDADFLAWLQRSAASAGFRDKVDAWPTMRKK